MRWFLCVALVTFCIQPCAAKVPNSERNAVITLVMGENSGYAAGAIALGQSLIDVGSKMKRIVMVTPDVDEGNRQAMAHLWEVVEVEPVYCNHKLHPSVTPVEYDLQGDQYLAGLKRWFPTCTKFAAWTFTDFERVIFMDSDMLVLEPIDSAVYEYSNASFLAAPECFPPDTFNSGFMVLDPSMATYQHLLQLNQDIGSAEGGDQGVFNNGLCPDWFIVDSDNPDCYRLPWTFNVEAQYYKVYHTFRKMSGQPPPAVIHFVSDGKPWKILANDYLQGTIADSMKTELLKQAETHLLWRRAFFRATGDAPPRTSVFDSITTDAVDEAKKQRLIQDINKMKSQHFKEPSPNPKKGKPKKKGPSNRKYAKSAKRGKRRPLQEL